MYTFYCLIYQYIHHTFTIKIVIHEAAVNLATFAASFLELIEESSLQEGVFLH